MTKATVAVIGVGLMGSRMARRLLDASHPVRLWNRTAHKCVELGGLDGSHVAATPAEAVAGADVVITMLSDAAAVSDIYLGSGGVADAVAKSAVLIDMSSQAPDGARQLHAALAERALAHLDAPVSGGVTGAAEGTLSIMVGGEAGTLESVRPVLEVLGNVFHIGAGGAGQVCKLVNQAIVHVSIGAVSEGLLLAAALGVDPSLVHQAIRGGYCQSRVLDIHGRRMIDRNFVPGGPLQFSVKDCGGALQEAARVQLSLPLTGTVMNSYQGLVASGKGQYDHSALVVAYEEANRPHRVSPGVTDQAPSPDQGLKRARPPAGASQDGTPAPAEASSREAPASPASAAAGAPAHEPSRHPAMYYLEIANEERKRVGRSQGGAPLLSSFVVAACVTYLPDSSARLEAHLTTTNSEPCSLSGSICAERAALAALPSLAPNLAKITGVYIVSDSPAPITPGMLCREYMATRFPRSVLDPAACRVALAGTAGEAVDRGSVVEGPLAAYWPAPSVWARRRVATAAFDFICPPCSDDMDDELYQAAFKAAKEMLDSQLHPSEAFHKVKYAAGVRFSDGSIATGRQVVGLEYGTTLDCVGQLAPQINDRLARGLKLSGVICVDNYGGAHAPFAVGRAYLSELAPRCTQDAWVFYHEHADGQENRFVMKKMLLSALCPGLPAFSTEDFSLGAKKHKIGW